MLIQALCDYYTILFKEGKVLSDAYSFQKIDYLISLTPEGKIDGLIACEKDSKPIVMPKRSEKPGICANVIEHRPLYLFGLNFEKENFTPDDKTDKARKSYKDFKEKNLDFIKDVHTSIVDAYRQFILNWEPETETENTYLLSIGKKYKNSSFAFCLSGHPEICLHKDTQLLERWEQMYSDEQTQQNDTVQAQCAVSGKESCIARIHHKIKGVAGGLATGSVLIGFNNPSENSYGNEQSYNSNISDTAMQQYTKALNYVLSDPNQRQYIDELTVIYWAMSREEKYLDLASMLMFEDSDKMDVEETEKMLTAMIKDSHSGLLSAQRVAAIANIDPNVDFYMVGIKPNSSRLSIKFINKQKFADMLIHVVQHQQDLQFSEAFKPVPLFELKKELVSPKSSNAKVNAALLAKIFEAMINGTDYPQAMLYETIRRCQTDHDRPISRQRLRAGMIKACLNRRARRLKKEEEIKVSLDKENKNPAYLCGRLFAALEKLQQDASGNSLNRTIKDAYFASASSRPAVIFPKLIRLAQNHLKKTEHARYFNSLIGEIIDALGSAFPDTLSLTDQGKFMIGYYQQYQNFFVKQDKKEEEDNA